jgi:Protein of unknown function (DUF992)
MIKLVTASLIAIAAFTTTIQAAGLKVGVLTCRVEGGAGFLIGSAKGVDCKYKPSSGGRAEHYMGSIGKIGLDIGITDDTVLGWIVVAPGKTKAGALKGSYTGLGAEATAGVGLGANILIGGFRQSINLQPLSLQAQTGLNISLAITSLTLRYDR